MLLCYVLGIVLNFTPFEQGGLYKDTFPVVWKASR